jgi:hypothetical protein
MWSSNNSVKELEASLATLTESHSADTESRVSKLLADVASAQQVNTDIHTQMATLQRYINTFH